MGTTVVMGVSVFSSPLPCSRGQIDDGSWFIPVEWCLRVVLAGGIPRLKMDRYSMGRENIGS